jgi:hypothetical protein
VTNAGPIIPFLEGTDVFFSLRRDTVFEADIMPHPGGQDYYNLGLLENIQRVHVGATFNQSGFFRFRRSE